APLNVANVLDTTFHCRSHLPSSSCPLFLFIFIGPTPARNYTLSLHDALPISSSLQWRGSAGKPSPFSRRCSSTARSFKSACPRRSEEHTSELQSRGHLVCRLLLEKKKPRNATQPASELVLPRFLVVGRSRLQS